MSKCDVTFERYHKLLYVFMNISNTHMYIAMYVHAFIPCVGLIVTEFDLKSGEE